MKKTKKPVKSGLISFVALFITAALLIGVTLFCVQGADPGRPTTFVGDDPWYLENKYKWAYIDGRIYVPITIFEKFGAEIQTSSKSVSLTIGDKLISFSTVDNTTAFTPEMKEFFLKTNWMSYHTLSVPASFICEYFGLKYESYTGTSNHEKNTLAIRISDGKGKYTLTDLLNMYNPQLIVRETTAAPETTAPVEQPARAYLIYLTFEDAPNQYTERILDLLAEYGYKATFFLNGDALTDNVPLVRRIILDGHSIGLHTMTRDSRLFARDINNFTDELREENKLLYRLFRTTTRLVRAPDGSQTRQFKISPSEGAVINSLGYAIWDFNVDTFDTAGYSAERVAGYAIDGIVKFEIPVLRFHSTQVTVTALKPVLEYIKSHSDQFSVAAITPSADNFHW